MFPPSANVLINRVDIYRGTDSTDLDGGYIPTYSLIKPGVMCSVQFDRVAEVVNDANGHRITEEHEYTVMFGSNPDVKPRDKFIQTDRAGNGRVLFVRGTENCAGRSAAFVVNAVERI